MLIGGSTDVGDQSLGGEGVDNVVVGAASTADGGNNAADQSVLRPPPDLLVTSFQGGASIDGSSDALTGGTGMNDGIAADGDSTYGDVGGYANSLEATPADTATPETPQEPVAAAAAPEERHLRRQRPTSRTCLSSGRPMMPSPQTRHPIGRPPW